jgi:hypothetical protein
MSTPDAAASVIGGLPIPDDRPIFLAILALHVTASGVCVLAGALAALSRKQPGRHPRAGRIYYWALTVTFTALLGLALLRWPHDTHLLAIGTVAITSATLGLLARRRQQPGWIRRHGTAMAISYIALLTGFYVDNGPHLPLWNLLPPITYWLLPAAAGVPLLVIALARNSDPRPAGARHRPRFHRR